MRRCWGTELKKPTRSSLVACKGMSASVCVSGSNGSGARVVGWTAGLDVVGKGVAK